MQNKNMSRTGVVLMTYGSATTADHVKEYFETIYGGRASAELIKDFENRYRLVGGSPLIPITKEQAHLLEEKLCENGNEGKYIVRAGMRHSVPKINEAIVECRKAGADRLVGIVLSPQFSSIIMGGYRTAFLNAAQENAYSEAEAVMAGPWPTEFHFIKLLAERVKKAHLDLVKKYNTKIPVIFTTHSLPESVVAKDPLYLLQLKSTIDAVRAELSDTDLYQWYAGYQSAGHTPEAWLKPDLTDILEIVSQKKFPAVLIVPIQFLADHLEILFDLDIAGREQCKERGIEYNRIELPNTDPLFIEALATIAKTSTTNRPEN